MGDGVHRKTTLQEVLIIGRYVNIQASELLHSVNLEIA